MCPDTNIYSLYIHYLIYLPCRNFLEHTYKQHVDIQTAQGSLRFKLYSVYLNISKTVNVSCGAAAVIYKGLFNSTASY